MCASAVMIICDPLAVIIVRIKNKLPEQVPYILANSKCDQVAAHFTLCTNKALHTMQQHFSAAVFTDTVVIFFYSSPVS